MSYAGISQYTMLWQVLGHIDNGYYVNIGAWNPEIHALSQAFHERGWTGIQVVSRTGNATRSAEDVDQGLSLRQLSTQAGVDTIHWMRVHIDQHAIPAFMDWCGNGVRPWILLVYSPVTDGISNAWESALFSQEYNYVGSHDAYRFYIGAECALEERFLQLLPWESPATDPSDIGRQLHTLQVKLRQSQAIAAEAERRRDEVEARLVLAEERAARLELAELAAAMQAQHVHALEHQVQAIYASSSWQVTKPMRWLSRMRRSPRSASLELVRFAHTKAKGLGNGLLRRSIKLVLANPPLYRLASRFVKRYPGFYARLRSHIAADAPAVHASPAGIAPTGIPPSPAIVAVPPASHTTVLGTRFRTLILDELARSTDASYEGKS